MSRPRTIDLSKLLEPIPGDNPAGRSLRFGPEMDELDKAARQDDPSMQKYLLARGETTKVADWKRVLELGTKLLEEKSKDLEVAARVAEAVGRLHGWAGLRDGFHLIRGLNVIFWKTYYPKLDPANLTLRKKPFVILENSIPDVIRNLPLTKGQAANVYTLARLNHPDRDDEAKGTNEAESPQGQASAQPINFEEAIARSSREFYEVLKQDLDECATALSKLERTNRPGRGGRPRRLSADPPKLSNVRKILEECRSTVDQIVGEKRRAEGIDVGTDSGLTPETADGEETTDSSSPASEHRPLAEKPQTQPSVTPEPIDSVARAIDQILAAAQYLRKNDATNPIGFLAVQAVRFGALYGMSASEPFTECSPPSSTVRELLVRLRDEEKWNELLEETQQALGRPEGIGWLDADYYLDLALRSSGVDRSAALRAIRSLLQAVVRQFPAWPEAVFRRDRTATASSETREWLRSEIVGDGGQRVMATPADSRLAREHSSPRSSDEDDDQTRDALPWVIAVKLAGEGRFAQAVQTLVQALQRAITGRDRFLIKLHLAELFLADGRHQLASPLAEDLVHQINEFHLEQWEEAQLLARVWETMLRCLGPAGSDNGKEPNEKYREALSRLCRIDVERAIQFTSK